MIYCKFENEFLTIKNDMREIKFRAWDKEDRQMIDWFTLTQSAWNTFRGDTPLSLIYKIFVTRKDDFEVMQFTGLTDENGIEIYEGDLLSDPYPIDDEDLSKGYHESFSPVVWCSKTLQWCVDASFSKDGSYLTSLVEYFGEFLNVKGNVHQNPELISKNN